MLEQSKKAQSLNMRVLPQFATDLTEQAKNGELSPVYGREREIEMAMAAAAAATAETTPIEAGR